MNWEKILLPKRCFNLKKEKCLQKRHTFFVPSGLTNIRLTSTADSKQTTKINYLRKN